MSRFERLSAACRASRTQLALELHVTLLTCYLAAEHSELWWLVGAGVLDVLVSVNSIVWHLRHPAQVEVGSHVCDESCRSMS